jgi:hypothetical protein
MFNVCMNTQIHEMAAAHERDKHSAMRDLTETLIPKIEQEMLGTHRCENIVCMYA